jgi:hypothetical protein
VPGLILATVTPDNTPGGANLTFAFPIILFLVIVVVLYLWLGRPHRRVPADLTPVGSSATTDAPQPEVARGASVAAGLPTAVGGGGAESEIEPAGGVRKDEGNGTSVPAADTEAPAAGTAETAASAEPPGTAGPAAATPETAAGTAEPPGTAGPADGSGGGTSAADSGTGNVSGQEPAPDAADPQRGTADGTEASE